MILQEALDQFEPTHEKIQNLKVGDCVRCRVYRESPDRRESVYPGDLLVVRDIYKHVIGVYMPGASTIYKLNVDEFETIPSKSLRITRMSELQIKLGDWIKVVSPAYNGIFKLNVGDIAQVEEITDYTVLVRTSEGFPFRLIVGDFELLPQRYSNTNQFINRSNQICDNIKNKEDKTMSMANELNKMFGAIQPGMCRLSMNGGVAVKTSSGYKSYNMKTGRLVNCDNFALDPGSEWFFCIPTNHVKTGDIILINGKPCCVKKADKDQLTVINYENNTVETVLPERHMFMGNMYFYSKVVSPFNTSKEKGGGMKKLMKYAMMSEMMKGSFGGNTSGNSGGIFGGMNPMIAMSMMGGGGFGDLFDGMFDDDDDGMDMFGGFLADDDEEEEDTPATPKKKKAKGTKPAPKKNDDEEEDD